MESGNLSIKYKNQVINIILIVIALFVCYRLYVGQQQFLNSLKEEKENETRKNAELLNIGNSEKKLAAYKKFINQKDLSSVMDTINSLAVASGVRIASVRPADEKVGPVVSEYVINYTVLAGSYHALGSFMGQLESHPFVFKVNRLDLKSNQGAPETTDLITADLEISTVLIR